jgi:hypothetical protein
VVFAKDLSNSWFGGSERRTCSFPVQICRIDAFLHQWMIGNTEEHKSALLKFGIGQWQANPSTDSRRVGCLKHAIS